MATPKRTDDATEVSLIQNAALLRKFAEMAGMLPDAEEGGGAERIIEQILNAKTWEDLDAPWRAQGGEQYLDKTLKILGATKRPSDFGQGLGIYVVVDAVDLTTGEAITFTTGSVSIVAQLVRAHCLGEFPIKAVIRQSERPTKDGYRPQHLEVTDVFREVAD